MLNNARSLMILALLSAGPLCSLTCATTRIVGKPNTNCAGAQYTTIQAAINAASSGDTIEVCPALYPEQLLITKPITVVGIQVENVNRVLVRPNSMSQLGGLSSEAVITVVNPRGNVTIQNLAVDATNNDVSNCSVPAAGIHYYNASGLVEHNAIFNALVSDPQECGLLFGSGFGVQVDSSQPGPFYVRIAHNSIHDYTRLGVLADGPGINVEVDGNTISGIGPAIGVLQFGVFVANGTIGNIHNNTITEGLCGSLSESDCFGLRSEGVTLRSPGDGTIVTNNVISQAQSGIFINGGNDISVTHNSVKNIEGLSGMDIQGSASGFLTNSTIEDNVIANVGPVSQVCSDDEECCGIHEYSGTGVSRNTIRNNTVNDAFCGVAAVEADRVIGGHYYNTLYTVLDSDQYPSTFPPASEP
ncbi:MAG TPA: right-handed parallel beta-helix repeat-containing protein [Bryobacteraceae bacterium]|nr:right-handed parallel beta-helix repeat-containing protein [Bryobacteraceae bacterium]